MVAVALTDLVCCSKYDMYILMTCMNAIGYIWCVLSARKRFESITKYSHKLAGKIQAYGPNHTWNMEVSDMPM